MHLHPLRVKSDFSYDYIFELFLPHTEPIIVICCPLRERFDIALDGKQTWKGDIKTPFTQIDLHPPPSQGGRYFNA